MRGGRSSARSSRWLSFVCSVGNVPLAAVLWNGGISFGGVIAFIFADLIILPILDIYRRYYGLRVAVFLFATLTRRWSPPGLIVGYLFDGLGLAPERPPREGRRRPPPRSAGTSRPSLDVVALAVAAALVWRFFASGGGPMLRMMDEPMGDDHDHSHHDHDHGTHAH